MRAALGRAIAAVVFLASAMHVSAAPLRSIALLEEPAGDPSSRAGANRD